MDELTALHTAARRYCLDRGANIFVLDGALHQRVFELDIVPQRVNTRPASVDVLRVARATVLGAILIAVETVVPGDFAALADMRAFLLETGRMVEAVPHFTCPPQQIPELEAAVEEQRRAFCIYIGSLTHEVLRVIAPLPYRRVLTAQECLDMWAKVQRRWGARPDGRWFLDGYWMPLDVQDAPEPVLTVQSPWFYQAIQPVQLQQILAAHGVPRVWLLQCGGRRDQFEMDAALLSSSTGSETHFALMSDALYTSENLDWILSPSHEDGLTIGGAWLIEAIKRIWPDWERHEYRGPVFERPMRDIDDANPIIPVINDLRSGDHARIARGREALRAAGTPAGESLLAVLHDPNASTDPSLTGLVRVAAAQALVAVGAPAVPGLISALTSDDTFVQAQAASILGHIGEQRAVEPLIAALRADGPGIV